jgi:hypothetical protein
MNREDINKHESKFVREPMSGCWLWIAGADKHGYGMLWDGKQQEPVAVELLRYHLDAEGYMVQDKNGEWIEFETVEALLESGEQQNPVAFRFKEDPSDLRSGWRYVAKKKHVPNGSPYQPLYTSPPASKPLTDEDMEQIAKKFSGSFASLVRCLREVEAAHGIYAPTERKGEV